MAQAAANGIEIEYETFGNPGDPPLLLIEGLDGQMINWDVGLCEQLRDRGFFVIRFDNRDVGLSTKFDREPAMDLMAILGGDPSSAPYLISDMADDTAALIDVLGLGAVHVVGVSMGGMIAQQLAIDHPSSVLSLCSIMSTTGERAVGGPSEAALAVVFTFPPPGREAYLDHKVRLWKVIGSPDTFDESRVRAREGACYDRDFTPAGSGRQLAAILASPDRTAALGAVRVPTLVIHGSVDQLVDPSGGRSTAAAVPGAELLVIEGMGHDLNPAVWDEVVDAVVKNAGR
jgi:pimeloyl-ACP methyl ester carboxylesterase